MITLVGIGSSSASGAFIFSIIGLPCGLALINVGFYKFFFPDKVTLPNSQIGSMTCMKII